jgi:hypothetical protein
MPEITQYISRIQSVMQQTRPDNNVLLYFPMYDLWSRPKSKTIIQMLDVHYASNEWLLNANVGKTGQVLLDNGYQFDYISDRQLQQLKADAQGQLLTQANIPYQTLVIPACTYMPLETLQTIARLVENGAKVVFVEKLPQHVPGFHQHALKEEQMQKLNANLSEGQNGPLSNNRRVHIARVLENTLAQLGIQREPIADKKLSFIRKNHPAGKIYFITNLQNTFREDTIRLHTSAQSVEIYNPLTGEKGLIDFKNTSNNITKLYLSLAPGKSCLVTTYDTKQTGRPWVYQMPKETEAIPLNGKWNLTFTTGEPILPRSTSTEKLTSWTMQEDSAAQYFSGTGVYTLQFTLPPKTDVSKSFLLDLGDVREIAQVTLNGVDIGKVWSLPFQVYIKPGLLKKRNTLEIAVTNLSANRIRYLDKQKVEWKKFHEINFVNIRYEPFDAAKWEPVESGLLGPVRLIPLK